MKKNVVAIFTMFLVAFLINNPGYSQLNTYKKAYTLIGEPVNILLNANSNNIQWQISDDMISWIDIPGENSTVLSAIIDTIAFVRAEIQHTDCPSYFSNIALIIPMSSINCPTSVADIDGNIYEGIQIGGQCWMRQNMKVTHYPNGVGIPLITDSYTWSQLLSDNYSDASCFYMNVPANAGIYGYLYTWSAAMGDNAIPSDENPSGVQGICPQGWHIPSDKEWRQLGMQLGLSWDQAYYQNAGGTNEGSKLSSNDELWSNGDLVMDDEFGLMKFDVLPGGLRFNIMGSYALLSDNAYLWSSSEADSQHAFDREILYTNKVLFRSLFTKSSGLSVRCLYDSVRTDVQLPIVVTYPPTGITNHQFTANGSILFNGLSQLTSYGFCYNDTGNPNIYDDPYVQTSGFQSLSAIINNLNHYTNYYFKAFAANSAGVSYGAEFNCLTGPGLPLVAIDSVFNVTQNSAEVNGSVVNDGGISVTNRGFCWSESINPVITDNHISLPGNVGQLAYTLNNLIANTTYYIRAFATNVYGTTYSDNISFLTNPTLPELAITYQSSNFTDTSLTINLTITDDGGSPVVNEGIYWNLIGNPGVNDSIIIVNPSAGNQEVTISGLTPITTYYLKGWAENGVGITISQEYVLSTLAQLPVLSTDSVNQIAISSAVLFGTTLSDAGSAIINRGFCYNILGNPTIANSSVQAGSGLGPYSASISNLLSNTIYYVRSWAESSAGIAYGNEIQFQTDFGYPVVTTDSVTGNSTLPYLIYGTVLSDGGTIILDQGFCFSNHHLPDTLDNHLNCNLGSTVFNTSLDSLIPGSAWYVRAYAKNIQGITYGDELKFVVPGKPCSGFSTVTDIDGNVYSTIQMGNQCWMNQNIKVQHYPDGTSIPYISNDNDWGALLDNDTSDAWGYFGNSINYLNEFGGLYSWAAAMGGHATTCNTNPGLIQGICPTGWHIPSNDEWKQLEINLGMSQEDADLTGFRGTNEGSILAGNYNNWDSGALRSNALFDSSSFDGKGVGYRHYNTGMSFDIKTNVYWWSSTESSLTEAFSLNLFRYQSGIQRKNSQKSNGFPVRCLRDGGIPDQPLSIHLDSLYNVTAESTFGLVTITDDGGSFITQRGICINQNGNPDMADNYYLSTPGNSSFIIQLTDLTPNTTYYARAFARNNYGIEYSNQLIFSTAPGYPKIEIIGIEYINDSTVRVDLEMINDGGSVINETGILYGISGNPNWSSSIVNGPIGQSSFSVFIQNIVPYTYCFLKAYSINSLDTGYSEIVKYNEIRSCMGSEKILDYDGNKYGTVQIGNQCWMNENLKTSHYNDGSAIPYASSITEWAAFASNIEEDGFCDFHYNANNRLQFGALYTWAAATGDEGLYATANSENVQGICPDGWRLPSKQEWIELEQSIGVDSSIISGNSVGLVSFKLMKSQSGWPSSNVTNHIQMGSAGFNAIPVGNVPGNGSPPSQLTFTQFWSASIDTNITPYNAKMLILNYNNFGVSNSSTNCLDCGLSVRCVRASIPSVNDLPTVNNLQILNISQNTCNLQAEVVSAGSSGLISRGFVWNVEGNPVIGDQTILGGATSGIFNLIISTLSPGHNYFIRAFASNIHGTSYSNQIKITTLPINAQPCPSTVEDADGNIYATVQIGSQCWMAENLKVNQYENSTLIPEISLGADWINDGSAALCTFSGSPFLSETYGKLYNWSGAIGWDEYYQDTSSHIQGVCPTGWHLPDTTEYIQMINYLNGFSVAGQSLKESGTNHWYPSLNNGNNISGFTALPGGLRNSFSGSDINFGQFAGFWTSTKSGYSSGYGISLNYNSNAVFLTTYKKNTGLSVRCIKD